MITLTWRPLSSAFQARFMCSAPALCAWCHLLVLLICLKLLAHMVGVCVRDGLAVVVCVRLTYAASVELLPRGWRTVALNVKTNDFPLVQPQVVIAQLQLGIELFNVSASHFDFVICIVSPVSGRATDTEIRTCQLG